MPNTQFGLLHLPAPSKLYALVELTTKIHEIAVAVDGAATAAVDAAAAAGRRERQ